MKIPRKTYTNLPRYFRKNGFDYKLSKSFERLGLYEQTKKKTLVGFEVIKLVPIKKDKAFRLPSNCEFGTYGWSFSSIIHAQKFFKQRIEEVKQMEKNMESKYIDLNQDMVEQLNEIRENHPEYIGLTIEESANKLIHEQLLKMLNMSQDELREKVKNFKLPA